MAHVSSLYVLKTQGGSCFFGVFKGCRKRNKGFLLISGAIKRNYLNRNSLIDNIMYVRLIEVVESEIETPSKISMISDKLDIWQEHSPRLPLSKVDHIKEHT